MPASAEKHMSRCEQQHVKSMFWEIHFFFKNSSIGPQFLYFITFFIFWIAISIFSFTLKIYFLVKFEIFLIIKHQFLTKCPIWMKFFLICWETCKLWKIEVFWTLVLPHSNLKVVTLNLYNQYYRKQSDPVILEIFKISSF